MRALGLALLLAAACAASGCLVATLQPVYTDTSLVSDDGLVGTWDCQELGATVVVERGEWKAYQIAYTSKRTSLTLVGYLTKTGEATLLDLSPAHGLDAGPLLFAAHGVGRFERAGDHLTVAPLDYTWFAAAAQARKLGKLETTFDALKNVLVTSPTEAARAWLSAQPASGDAFGEPVACGRKRP